MGKEFVIDNLDDMCALMCDNVTPCVMKIKEVDEIPSKQIDRKLLLYHSQDVRNFIDKFINMNTRIAEITVNDNKIDINNLRRRFQTICDTEYMDYRMNVIKRGDRVYLKRW